jgi:hypothetical protein
LLEKAELPKAVKTRRVKKSRLQQSRVWLLYWKLQLHR